MPSALSVPNTFVAGTPVVAAEANANFAAVVAWVNSNAVATDGTKAFTGIPDLPAADPTTANQAVRKAYVDATVPVGAIIPFGGSSAPSRWLLCQGQLVSRATYADLFAVIGTTYGAGDGSTTFALPDLRGRIPVGRDASVTVFDTLGEAGGSRNAVNVAHQHTVVAHTHDLSNHVHNALHGHTASSSSTASDHTHSIPGVQVMRLDSYVNLPEPYFNLTDVGDSVGMQMFYSSWSTHLDGAHTHPITVNNANFNTGAPSNNTSGSASPLTSSEGVSGTDANLQPYLVVNYIIRTNVV